MTLTSDSATAPRPSSSPSAATTPGSTLLTARTLRAYASAIAAESLLVDAGDVSVSLRDDRGMLALALEAPTALAQAGSGLVARVDATRAVVRERMQELTGRSVGRIDIVITGRRVREIRRVR